MIIEKTIHLLLLTITIAYCSLAQAADKLPQRIISLAPANTEILYALNLGDKIVGVTSYCNYPPQATRQEKVGDFSQPNIEKIISLKPDIIFATGLEQSPVVDKMRSLGLNVVVIDPTNFRELFDSIATIGSLTGTQTYAYLLNESMKKRISNVLQSITQKHLKQPPRIFIEISLSPLMTAAKNTFLDEIINMLRAFNIAADCPRPYCQISEEFVIAQNPDYIIATSPQAKSFFTKRTGWTGVRAVKNRCVLDDIDPDLLMRPGPRLVDGLEQLAERIYGLKSR